MIRNAIYSFLLVALAATAVVILAPNSVFSAQNNAFSSNTFQTADRDVAPHRLIVHQCALEDCSDTPQ